MAITERLMGPGNFTVTFTQEFTPTAIIEAIKELKEEIEELKSGRN